MKYVFAGNYSQYIDWCKDHIVPSIYIDQHSIIGKKINPEDIVFYGSWRDRKDYNEVVGVLKWCTMEVETFGSTDWDRIRSSMAERYKSVD